MSEQLPEHFEAAAVMPPSLDRDVPTPEEERIPESDLKKAGDIFDAVKAMVAAEGEPIADEGAAVDMIMANLVEDANRFTTEHPGDTGAKIANIAGAYEILENPQTSIKTTTTLAEQPKGLLKEAIDDIRGKSSEAAKFVTKAIDGASALARLQPDYAIQQAPRASARYESRKGVTGAEANNERVIAAHLTRLERVASRVGAEKLFEASAAELVVAKEDIPEGYYDSLKHVLRDNGQGGFVLEQKFRDEEAAGIQESQKKSLDGWKNALVGSTYPTWFKVYAWEGMSKMGTFNFDKHAYNKRSRGTTAPYPTVNTQALEHAFNAISAQFSAGDIPENEQLAKAIQGGNFNKIYSAALLEVKDMIPTPKSAERAKNGEWKTYTPDQVSELMEASEGTPWCLVDREKAEVYLRVPQAEFYLYHMKDGDKVSASACASIRMQEGRVAEISGLDGGSRQLLEPSLTDVVRTKVAELPGGERFLHAYDDRDRLKSMDEKVRSGEDFTIDELKTLYEIDRAIEYPTTDHKRINDPRPKEFKGNTARHREQLREVYGDNADWLVEPVHTLLPDTVKLLENGADATQLWHKMMEVGETRYGQSVMGDAGVESSRFSLVMVSMPLFPEYVRHGLSREKVRGMFDAQNEIGGMFGGSLVAGFLEAGIPPDEILGKIPLPDEYGDNLVRASMANFLRAGVSPERILERSLDSSGKIAFNSHVEKGVDGNYTVSYPEIDALAEAGMDMHRLALQMDILNLRGREIGDEFARYGVDTQKVIGEIKRKAFTKKVHQAFRFKS